MFERFNKFIHPQGGKFFEDSDGVRHKADQWEHLVNRVASYRKRAGKPPGDPRAEIESQVCARQPGYCIQERSMPGPVRPERENPGQMTKKIMKWLAGILNLRRAGKAKKISREEARRRSTICAQCPQQRKMSLVCGACNATRKSAAVVLLGSEQRIKPDLGGCRILQEDTSISVHLEQAPAENPELPPECWRK